MPRKKSIKKAAQVFKAAAAETDAYVKAVGQLSDAQISRVHDGAVIALYRDFENLVLEALVGAINNNTRTVSAKLGVVFPKHLTDEVCRYIITGSGYFDFKGRGGLLDRVQKYVPRTHYLYEVLSDQRYKDCLECLCALRNLAAHGSPQSKKAALKAISQTRVGSAGSWLKCQGRFPNMVQNLTNLADELEQRAPY